MCYTTLLYHVCLSTVSTFFYFFSLLSLSLLSPPTSIYYVRRSLLQRINNQLYLSLECKLIAWSGFPSPESWPLELIFLKSERETICATHRQYASHSAHCLTPGSSIVVLKVCWAQRCSLASHLTSILRRVIPRPPHPPPPSQFNTVRTKFLIWTFVSYECSSTLRKEELRSDQEEYTGCFLSPPFAIYIHIQNIYPLYAIPCQRFKWIAFLRALRTTVFQDFSAQEPILHHWLVLFCHT